jgi:hypothetical protein
MLKAENHRNDTKQIVYCEEEKDQKKVKNHHILQSNDQIELKINLVTKSSKSFT